jgi:kumamolisin
MAQTNVAHKGQFVGKTNPSTVLHLSFSLKERDAVAETQFIKDLYNPHSANYHQYLNPQQYADQFGPTAATRQQVVAYLQGQGFTISNNDSTGSLIEFEGSVSSVEKAFQLTINDYKDATGRIFYENDKTPVYPQAVAQLTNGVVGLSTANQPQPRLKSVPNTVSRTTPGGGYSPVEVRNAYNVTPLIGAGYDGTGQKIALYELDGYDPNNVYVYTNTLGLNPPPLVNIPIAGASTFSQDGNGQIEVELDIEAAIAVAPKAQVLVYVATGNGSTYVDLYQKIATDNLASQVSTSWGNYNEDDKSLLQAEEQIFRQFAIQGQSFYSASGDIYSDPYNNNGTVVGEDGDPEDNPYTTVVGGTSLYMNGAEVTSTYKSETTWNNSTGGSTGGISTYFKKTENPWQVGTGTDLHNTFNPQGGRQEPDVAALADPFTGFGIYSNNTSPGWFSEGGTSLASPLWAGFNAVMNQYILAHSGTRIGFPAPALYRIFNNPSRYAADFHDITIGGNDPNCLNPTGTGGTAPNCGLAITTSVYYSSTVGYDLVTGIGTPNINNLASDLVTGTSQLLVSPASVTLGLGSSSGGFVTSQAVTLTALNASINYTSTAAPSWLSVSAPSGTIAANSSVVITLTVLLPSPSSSTTIIFGDTADPTNDYAILPVTFNAATTPPPTTTTPPVTTTTPPVTGTTPVTTTPPIITGTTYTYYLPFLANAYNSGNGVTGSFTTFLAFQNTGSNTANVNIQYFDVNGVALSGASVMTTTAKYGETIASNPLATGAQGTGVITSDQPLAVIVAEATPYGGSAYAVNAGTGSTLNAPFSFNGAFGGYTTQLTVFNAGSSQVTATVNFYDTSGSLAAVAVRNVTIGAKQSVTLDQGAVGSGLPVGFNGWAQVVGAAGSTLVAQVLEQNPVIRYVSIVNAQASGASTVYAPAVFKDAYGGFYTGADIVNIGSTPVTVTATYYSITGTVLSAAPFALSGYGVASIYHGSTVAGTGLPGTGLPAGFIGAASISVQGGKVIMAVNEFGGYTSAGTTESGTYSAASSGSNTVALPVMANNGFGYTTGTTILNTSNQTVTGTLQYYNLAGTATGTLQNFSIGPNASQAFYQGDPAQALGSGFYGVAVISQTGGPANSLIDTTNAISASFFYTYVEPTQ